MVLVFLFILRNDVSKSSTNKNIKEGSPNTFSFKFKISVIKNKT